MPQIATKVTRKELSAAATIEPDGSGNAQSIRVHGIFIANESAAAVIVNITDNAGTVLFSIPVEASANAVPGNFTWETPFMADKGIKIASLSDADISVTVVHGAAGA